MNWLRRTRQLALGVWAALALACFMVMGCDPAEPNGDPGEEGAEQPDSVDPLSLRVQLNWVPEPEFGGYYAARSLGLFADAGLEVELVPGGIGIDSPELLANGEVDFAIVSADQIVQMRGTGRTVVAVHASFQTSPRGIIVHQQSPFPDLESLWRSDATLIAQTDANFIRWLNHRYDGSLLQFQGSDGTLDAFIADPTLAQAIYVFAEPAELEVRGVAVKIFPTATSGYNPYAAVLASRDEYVATHGDIVGKLVTAVRAGWDAYLKAPDQYNQEIANLNPAMSLEAMNASARLLAPYVATKDGLLGGQMSEARWSELIEQMASLGALNQRPEANACFRNTFE